jgi:hypothetical protein
MSSSAQNFQSHVEGLNRLARLALEMTDYEDLRWFQFQQSMCDTFAAIAIFVVVCDDAVEAVNQGGSLFSTRSMLTSCF